MLLAFLEIKMWAARDSSPASISFPIYYVRTAIVDGRRRAPDLRGGGLCRPQI